MLQIFLFGPSLFVKSTQFQQNLNKNNKIQVAEEATVETL